MKLKEGQRVFHKVTGRAFVIEAYLPDQNTVVLGRNGMLVTVSYTYVRAFYRRKRPKK